MLSVQVSQPRCQGRGFWVMPQKHSGWLPCQADYIRDVGVQAALLSLNKSVTELSTRISSEMLDLVTHCTLQRAAL